MNCHQAAEKVREKKGSQGYTLIEVLIALSIFSLGILAVGAMQITSTNSYTGARIHTEEYSWVVDQIERLTALDYDHPDLVATEPPATPLLPHLDPRPKGPYTVSWTVVDNSPVTGAKRIAVTVTGSHRRARPIRIDFIKAR